MTRRVEQHDDELAEFDLTEAEIDAMMAGGEPVQLGGPPGSSDAMMFVLAVVGRRYRWQLVSEQGTVLATGGEYPTKRDALQAIEAVARAAGHAALIDQTGQAS